MKGQVQRSKVKVKGQGQLKIYIITKIPYYRPLEERKKLRLNEEAREKKVIFLG